MNMKSLRKSRWFVITMIIGGVLLVGILGFALFGGLMGSGDYYAASYAPEAIQSTQVAFDYDAEESAAGDTMVSNRQAAPPGSPQEQERIILRDASMTITVEDTEATITSISSMANEMGGWVVTANSSSYTHTNDQRLTNGNVTVRVPAERLDEALTIIRDGAIEVQSENINGRDVTEEYVDLSSRLGNLEATEDQLVEILDTAYTVEDVLAVQRELTTVRGQIEQIEGRLRYFDEAAAFSSIAVTVREQVPSVGNVQVAGWNPLNTAANALGTLLVIGQFLADSVITLAIIGIPALVVLWFVIAVIRRAWRMLRGNRAAQPVTAAE